MTTSTPRSSTPPSARARWVRTHLPPQHGAWAMLLLPVLVGAACTRFVPAHALLLVAALTGYPFSYYAFLAVKTRRWERVRSQLTLYAPPAAVAGLALLALRPALLWFAPAFAGLLGINALAARRRADRSLVSGIASVAAGCLFAPVAAVTAGAAAGDVTRPTLVLFVYFVGTVFFVKTMIREAGDPGYRAASAAVHLVALGVAAWASPWLAVPFAALLARAVALPVLSARPGHRLRPAQVGMIELAASVVLLVMLPLLLR